MLALILISLLNYLVSSPYLIKISRALTLLLRYADLCNEDTPGQWKLQSCVCVCLFSMFSYRMKENNSVRAFCSGGLYVR